MQFEPANVDRAFYERLREHWSEPDIVELGVFIGFNVGYHTFFRTLEFYPMFTPDGRLVSQEESRRIYGDTPRSHRDPSIVAAMERSAKAAAEVAE
jgi:hypothetical protein